MKLDFFFQGMMSREEAASAFLAMALDGSPRFRSHFLRLVSPEGHLLAADRDWNVRVEVDAVDVRMDAGEVVVLIENKVYSGSKQQGQLLRYYKGEAEGNPDARIVAVFLAPGNVGQDEVEEVEKSRQFQGRRARDSVQHVSWEDVADYVGDGDPWQAMIRSGLDAVSTCIEEGRRRGPRTGDSALVAGIVDRAAEAMRLRVDVALGRWSGRDFEEILTYKTNVTMWLDAQFEVQGEEPYEPVGVRDENGLIHLTVCAKFKLAGHVRKRSELARWYQEVVDQGSFAVPGVGGQMVLASDGWFTWSAPCEGPEDSVAQPMADVGAALLGALDRSLAEAGLSLRREPEAR